MKKETRTTQTRRVSLEVQQHLADLERRLRENGLTHEPPDRQVSDYWSTVYGVLHTGTDEARYEVLARLSARWISGMHDVVRGPNPSDLADALLLFRDQDPIGCMVNWFGSLSAKTERPTTRQSKRGRERMNAWAWACLLFTSRCRWPTKARRTVEQCFG